MCTEYRSGSSEAHGPVETALEEIIERRTETKREKDLVIAASKDQEDKEEVIQKGLEAEAMRQGSSTNSNIDIQGGVQSSVTAGGGGGVGANQHT